MTQAGRQAERERERERESERESEREREREREREKLMLGERGEGCERWRLGGGLQLLSG